MSDIHTLGVVTLSGASIGAVAFVLLFIAAHGADFRRRVELKDGIGCRGVARVCVVTIPRWTYTRTDWRQTIRVLVQFVLIGAVALAVAYIFAVGLAEVVLHG